MQNYHSIFKKNPLFEKCPSCGAVNSLHRSHSRDWKESMIKRITFFKIYRCKKCGWRGFFSTFNFNIFSVKYLLYYVVLALAAAIIVFEILKKFVH